MTLHKTKYFLFLRQNANWKQAIVRLREFGRSCRNRLKNIIKLSEAQTLQTIVLCIFFCVLLLMDIYLMV